MIILIVIGYAGIKPTEYRRGKTWSISPFKRTLCLPHKKKKPKKMDVFDFFALKWILFF